MNMTLYLIPISPKLFMALSFFISFSRFFSSFIAFIRRSFADEIDLHGGIHA